MLIDTQVILSNSGKSEEFECNADFDSIKYQGNSYSIKNKFPFQLSLVNKDGKKLCITAKTHLIVELPCDRCLEPTDYNFDISIERELKISDGQVALDPDEEEDSFYFDHKIDIDRLLLDEIYLNWPAKILCRSECKGICSVCGQNLNLAECSCDRTVLDPRMAAFQDILSQIKEV